MFKAKAEVKPLIRQLLPNGIMIEAVPAAPHRWSVTVTMTCPLEQHHMITSDEEAAILVKLLAEKYDSFGYHLAQFIDE